MPEDLSVLIHARAAVFSRGSFGVAVQLLSPRAKDVYTFADGWEGIGRHTNCAPTEEYSRLVLARWTKAPEQIALMLTARCASWRVVDT
jgi:hypothetical protein